MAGHVVKLISSAYRLLLFWHVCTLWSIICHHYHGRLGRNYCNLRLRRLLIQSGCALNSLMLLIVLIWSKILNSTNYSALELLLLNAWICLTSHWLHLIVRVFNLQHLFKIFTDSLRRLLTLICSLSSAGARLIGGLVTIFWHRHNRTLLSVGYCCWRTIVWLFLFNYIFFAKILLCIRSHSCKTGHALCWLMMGNLVLLLLLLIEKKLCLRTFVSRNVCSCILSGVSSRPTWTCRFYCGGCLLLNICLALNLRSANSWILMHGRITTVSCLLTHCLYYFFEIFRIHLSTGMSFLDIV